jgi:hypothetical protein
MRVSRSPGASGPRPRLAKYTPPDFGTFPPWIPIPTTAAANYFNVHPKTLLRWHRLGGGPEPEPRGRYTHNRLYWRPAVLRAWWEANFTSSPRTPDEVVFEWLEGMPPWARGNWPGPPRPSRRVLRRRTKRQRSVLP